MTTVPRAPFARADVVGLGLLGLSAAFALRARGAAHAVRGFDPDPEARRLAAARGLEVGARWTPGGAELVLLAAPPSAVCELVAQVAREHGGALVTDVASLKGPVVAAAEAALARAPGFLFVGSHPLAGGASRGGAGARADLFVGAAVAVTPAAGVPGAAAFETARLWQLLGAVPYHLDAAAHDRAVARTSHLPQLAANALAAVVARHFPVAPSERGLIGSGLLDSTRVAAGDETLWGEILAANSSEIAPLARALAAELTAWAQALESGTPASELSRRWLVGASFRRGLGGTD